MNSRFLLIRSIYENPSVTQRELAAMLSISSGSVNALMADALSEGFIEKEPGGRNSGCRVTEKGLCELKKNKVDRAVIFASGFGSRFVPLTWNTPKGLLKVFGEPMVERAVKQLKEAGIDDIYIIVGYLKEQFSYLKDKYGVKLLENPEYDTKNTLATMYHARDILKGKNCYVIYSDNWLSKNLYHSFEADSWYSSVYMDGKTSEWALSCNKKNLITDVHVGGSSVYVMYGPIFLNKDFLLKFLPVLEEYYDAPGTEQFYWENVYMDWVSGTGRTIPLSKADCPELYINRQPDGVVYEFESLEEMREFDKYYSGNDFDDAIKVITQTFNIESSEIKNIADTKLGMTNHSFTFTVHNKPYLCRLPRESMADLVNRRDEYESIKAAQSLNITENVLYYNAETGYKVSEYIKDASKPDIQSDSDMKSCMGLLRKLHEKKLKVSHSFDLKEKFLCYENLCLELGDIDIEGYEEDRKNAIALFDKLSSLDRPQVFCHVDPNPDNFLMVEGNTPVLIDWEYAGMADPLLDIAGFTNYVYLDKEGTDRIASFYFDGTPSPFESGLIYAYNAALAVIWMLYGFHACFFNDEYYKWYTKKQQSLFRYYLSLALPLI